MQIVKLVIDLFEALVVIGGGLAWLFGWIGRKLGVLDPYVPPSPDHDVGARPLKAPLSPFRQGSDPAP